MQLKDITCWLFTDSRFGEADPFSRFELEMLEALNEDGTESDPELGQRLRKRVLERTEQIFESDLSWGQNVYSRRNLRWVSFIAAYSLTMRETLDDPAPHVRRLVQRIERFGDTRLFPLWVAHQLGDHPPAQKSSQEALHTKDQHDGVSQSHPPPLHQSIELDRGEKLILRAILHRPFMSRDVRSIRENGQKMEISRTDQGFDLMQGRESSYA